MRKIFILLLAGLLCVRYSSAQISSPREPRSLSAMPGMVSANVPTIPVNPPSLQKSARVSAETGLRPFAKVCDVAVPFMEQASVCDIDGGRIYRLSLKSTGAYSIGLQMTHCQLAPGSELYVYGADTLYRLGAVTSDANNILQELRTAQIPGDSVVVELYVPQGVSQKSFDISGLYYDFADFFADLDVQDGGHLSKASVCSSQEDLACYSGSEYDAIRQAVLKYSFEKDGYVYLCTGTLVNSLRCDAQPLVLTAAHCICDDESASTALFYFNYRRNNCYGSVGDYQTLSGASLLASAPKRPYVDRFGASSKTLYPVLDFSLLRLNNEIPFQLKPYFAGISLSLTDNMKTVSCLHHPNGNTMKVSISNAEPFIDTYPEDDPDCHYNEFSHWHISQWDIGTTEGGSSGAALLDENMQIIGTLSGGYASCFSPVDDFFQMLTPGWNLYPARENQLKYWLAPDSDLRSIPPYDPYFVANPLPRSHITAVCQPDSLVAHLSWQTVSAVTYRGESDSEAVGYGLVLPRINLAGGDKLTFRARAIGGDAVLSIGQNIRPQRFKQLADIEVGQEWGTYSVDLSQVSSSYVYIKFSVSADGQSDIAIGDVVVSQVDQESAMSGLTGYQLWCNGELVRRLPAGTTSCDFDIPHGSSYSFYILNSYGDDVSTIDNIVTLAPGYVPGNTPVDDLQFSQSADCPVLCPNPARGSASIIFHSSIGDARIDIVDMNGRVIASRSISGVSADTRYDISLQGISAGVYIIKVYNREAAAMGSAKLIVY